MNEWMHGIFQLTHGMDDDDELAYDEFWLNFDSISFCSKSFGLLSTSKFQNYLIAIAAITIDAGFALVAILWSSELYYQCKCSDIFFLGCISFAEKSQSEKRSTSSIGKRVKKTGCY